MEGKAIYEKIAGILKETKAITKSEKNKQQDFMFRGIDNVMNELHDIFAKNEVFILPTVLEYTVDVRQTVKGGTLFHTRVKVKFQYTTTDGSFVETQNVGEAMDSGDKGMNKAMSIALKYSLLQMLLIPTEEPKDPDANTPDEIAYNSTQGGKKSTKKILPKTMLNDPKVLNWLYDIAVKKKKENKQFSVAATLEANYIVQPEDIEVINDNLTTYMVANNLKV